ncbi:class I SAM-dependent methyltransferase [Natronomonas sp. EA1]|uniref:class I SAM-dependent methyltransferase n=1 Tax=Natronomonas sp. EA1 TaxID=3421655 RepID=UPI003EBF6FA8
MSREPMRDDAHGLALLVPRERAQDAIDAAKAANAYDDARKVQPEGERIAIPVAEAFDLGDRLPDGAFEDIELPHRIRDLRDHLEAKGWTDEELTRAPSSWAVVGSAVLVDIEESPRPEEVGHALLELHREADTVLARRGIDGQTREPNVEPIAGFGDTEVVHTEHGTRYALDLSEVMFSPGNQAERARMGEVVSEDERVFDMFAGIGYFTLPMARAGAHVTAAEINPESYRYLIENAMLNGVQDRIDAYRADCRDVDTEADRVVMGYYGHETGEGREGEAHECLDSALAALVDGGVVHMHEATPEARLWDRPISRLEAAVAEAGRTCEILDTRVVKSHSAGVQHVVVDARVD